MSESARDELTVSDREFTVRKSLNSEQFQTLAVVFDIRSARNESTRIQLSDVIPDEIPMDDIGFHPEYGGDHWTIDGQRVVFERSFDPGEEYTTIYGVRDLTADEADGLMTDPSIDIIEDPDDAIGDIGGIDDIVDEESSEAVRDVIAGDRDTLPGLEETADAEAPGDAMAADEEGAMTIEADDIEPPEEPLDADSPFADEPALGEPTEDDGEPPVAEGAETGAEEPDEEPLEAAEEADSILPGEDEPLLGEPDEEEPDELEAEDAISDEEGSLLDQDEPLLGEPDEPDEPGEGDVEAAADEIDVAEGDEPSPGTEAAESEPMEEQELTVPVTGGVARVLAKELREGNVSDQDRKLLSQELGSVGGSTETRIDHLQSRVSDLEAYTDALEAFLNEKGRGREILDDLRDGMDALEEDVSRIESRLAANAESIEDVRDELREVEGEVGELGGDLDRIDEQVARVDDVVQDLDDDIDHLGGVMDRTDTLEDELEEVQEHLTELDDFRRRLSSAFGGGGDDGGSDV